MTDEEQKAADLDRVRAAVAELGEHFDSVQIFCTRNTGVDDGNTIRLQNGVGNWFARFGHVKYWLLIQEEMARVEAREE